MNALTAQVREGVAVCIRQSGVTAGTMHINKQDMAGNPKLIGQGGRDGCIYIWGEKERWAIWISLFPS